MSKIWNNLTRLQIRVIGGRFTQTRVIEMADGRRQEVFLFNGDRALFSGQCTFYNTIIISESVIDRHPLGDYVLAHEMQHRQQGWRFLIFPLVLLMVFGISDLFPGGVDLLSDFRISIILSVLLRIGLAAVLVAIPCLFSWFLEIDADFKAIRVVGLPAYLDITEGSRFKNHRLIQRALNRLTHPPPKLVVWAWNRRFKGPP
jgi:hypothetical protein